MDDYQLLPSLQVGGIIYYIYPKWLVKFVVEVLLLDNTMIYLDPVIMSISLCKFRCVIPCYWHMT